MEILSNQQRNLPSESTVLVLGVLSLIGCLCYGVIGLILGIIAVVVANSQREEYFSSPSEYRASSLHNVNIGRTCGIIAICISGLIVLFWILIILGITTTVITTLGALAM